jgi:hypothetical protein
MRCMAVNVLCVVLLLAQAGCRSVYRFHFTSRPMPAGVLVGQEMLGETECTVHIPKDSEWIQDGKIEFTFCLPDGREKVHVVDLHGLRPSNPLAEIVSAPFVVLGAGLLLLSGGDDEEDDNDAERGLLGVGVLAVGAGVFQLLGGDGDSLTPYGVHVDFTKPSPETEDHEETASEPSP